MKFLAVSGTRIFITAFTSASRLSVFWSIWRRPTPWRPVLIAIRYQRLKELLPPSLVQNTPLTAWRWRLDFIPKHWCLPHSTVSYHNRPSLRKQFSVLFINRILYIGCPRRNVPDLGKVFLMLKYTDITQNTYVQIWTVTEIMAREVW